MGLDMWLSRRRYISNEDKSHLEIKGIDGIDLSKISYITEEILYWRKCNSVHRWFVQNIQDGNDDCNTYYVSKENLQELLISINTVLDDHDEAKNLLPTSVGFFFGNTEYDEYYYNQLERSKIKLDEILKNWDDNWEYEYNSSW